MNSDTPLAVLLSQVLLAFTIEFDNAFEEPTQGSSAWFRVSIVMWSNFMRFVDKNGTPAGDIAESACVPLNAVASVVGGMERWGYITVEGRARGHKDFGSGRGVKPATVIKPSPGGVFALAKWDGLTAEIEKRWAARLGTSNVSGLRDALVAVEQQIDLVMPHYLPIIGPGGGFTRLESAQGHSAPDTDLPALLARVLLAFTLDYEAEADVSLPFASTILRVLGKDPVLLKDLPLMSGISKEAVSMSLTWLGKEGYASVEPNPEGKGKIVRITPKGEAAQAAHRARLAEVEAAWKKRFGSDAIAALRSSLDAVLDGPLAEGLVTPPGGWRATAQYKPLTDAFVADPRAGLPQHPMVLHRGGWPDGS